MRRALTAGVVLLVAGGWMYWTGREPSVDCATYSLNVSAWRAEKALIKFDDFTDGERFTRQAARNLVRCHSLRGLTEREVRARLGKPDYRARDGQPRPHVEYGYIVGYTPERGSNENDSLFMEFDKGRIVYVAAPSRDRGRRIDVEDGKPVGGGP
jgi:hypothetical protein